MPKRLSQFVTRFPLTLALLGMTVATFAVYVVAEKRIDAANAQRHASILLADELRQSSDDLTRMVRAYAATGNPVYKRHFHEILDIRNGKQPRPANYHAVYWDLGGLDDERPRPLSKAIPLLTLMQEAGFTDLEFAKLAEAKANSDELTQIEFAAMTLLEKAPQPTPANRERAIEMLHDVRYLDAKARIMKPISEAVALSGQRTLAAVNFAEDRAFQLRIVFIFLAALLTGQLFALRRREAMILGGSVERVLADIAALGRIGGTESGEAPPTEGGSILEEVARTKARLVALDTDRKRSEDALRVSHGQLNEAQRIASIGSWMLDLRSNRLEWSDEIYRIFEIDQTRFGASYQAFLDAIHPEDRELVNRAYTESLANRTPYEITHRLLFADGRIKHVQERCETIYTDGGGPPILSRGTVQDITERKSAEAELRIAAAAFESSEGMMVTDAQGIILRINKAFTAITGYAAEEVVGKTPRILQSGRHDADFYEAMWQAITETGSWQGEIWDKHKSGRIYPKWLTISAVCSDAGGVTHYVGTQYDITERKQYEEQINTLAFYDQLTGLPNRILLLDRLSQSMSNNTRNGGHGALMFIDLDNFKTLNDTQGHEAGDRLLKQVALRLKQCLREEDTAARQGGDEFVVVLTGLGRNEHEAAQDAETVAEKILAQLREPYLLGDLSHRCSASIGVTLFQGHQSPVEELMKQGDLAMYKAKTAGRNAVRFYDPALETAVQARALMESDLRNAIETQQFSLHYQPQVVGTDRIVGAEVLVRWRHPQRGIVSPADFIPLAEETNLILPLGDWVMRTACQQLVRWASRPELAELNVAVNVSARQFLHDDFAGRVRAILLETGANPQRLKLELTESLLAKDIERIITTMHELKAQGIGFSLDDFGTGYSSLSYLKRLPLDQLKIDQSFVRDVLSDANDAAIAKTIVALGQTLGLSVIAEGVETEAQREFLAASGCPIYQGYLFSHPVPAEEFEQLLLKNRSGNARIPAHGR